MIAGCSRVAQYHAAPRPASDLATAVNGKPRIIMLLPGPPHELQAMWDTECMPRLRESCLPRPSRPGC